MTIEERLEALSELYGRNCPRAVSLKGPPAIEAWAEQQELDIAAAEEAEAQAVGDGDEGDVSADGEPGTGRPFGTPDTIEAIHERLSGLESFVGGAELTEEGAVLDSVLTRLTALESAVDALALSAPTEEAVGAVAAGGEPGPPTINGPHDPEPDGTKAPPPEKGKGKGSKKAGKK